jgi:hypothetical protein
MAGDGPGYKVSLGSSSGVSGADGVYTKIDDPGTAVVDYYYYYHPKSLTYRIRVPKSGGAGPMQLEMLTPLTRSREWRSLFTLIPAEAGAFKVQRAQGAEGNVEIQGAAVTYLSQVQVPVVEIPRLDADELSRAIADAAKSDAVNDKAVPVPVTLSACESLRGKLTGTVVLCDPAGDPSATARVVLKRGAASSIGVTLHKAESGAWEGYGLAQNEPSSSSELKGAFVSVDASGLVACVWDTPVPETAKYTATIVEDDSSSYRVYKLTPSRLDTIIIVQPGLNPFPEKPLHVAKSCEALAKKENDPKVPVSCGASGEPSVVRVTRGAAVYARVPLYKHEAGAWGGYGTDGTGSGVYVLVAATGHDVACVWDGAVTTTVAYKATPSVSEGSTYALVPTNAGQSHATLVLVSGPTPFPIRTGAPRAESKLSPGAIAGIVAASVFVLFLVATAFLLRRRRR